MKKVLFFENCIFFYNSVCSNDEWDQYVDFEVINNISNKKKKYKKYKILDKLVNFFK